MVAVIDARFGLIPVANALGDGSSITYTAGRREPRADRHLLDDVVEPAVLLPVGGSGTGGREHQAAPRLEGEEDRDSSEGRGDRDAHRDRDAGGGAVLRDRLAGGRAIGVERRAAGLRGRRTPPLLDSHPMNAPIPIQTSTNKTMITTLRRLFRAISFSSTNPPYESRRRIWGRRAIATSAAARLSAGVIETHESGW